MPTFLEKKKGCKIAATIGGSTPRTPLASGSWGLRPQTLAFFLLLTDIICLKSAFLAWTYFITLKNNTEVTNSKKLMLYFCFFRAFAPIFHFKL